MKIDCRNKSEEKYWDDPQWDCTDAAHPAWWRGEKWSAYMAAKLIADILSDKDTGEGMMNEPLETMRRSVMDLKKEHDNFKQKIKKLQKRNDNQAKTIRSYQIGDETKKFLNQINELFIRIGLLEKERDELQTKLDQHTKYEGGVSMKCGHPVQCAYAAAWIDGGNGCSMCDMKKEIEQLKIKSNLNEPIIDDFGETFPQ